MRFLGKLLIGLLAITQNLDVAELKYDSAKTRSLAIRIFVSIIQSQTPSANDTEGGAREIIVVLGI